MAKKDEPKIVLERTYIVPLRQEFLKKPLYKRAKKAVTALRQFVEKHMKSDNVKIGKHINEEIWKHGIKHPPHHVKVVCKKDSEGMVTVEMVGVLQEKKEKKVSHIKKQKEGKIEEQLEKIQEAKKEHQEEAKEIQKEEIDELKKHPEEIHDKSKKMRKDKPDHFHASPKGEQELSGPANR